MKQKRFLNCKAETSEHPDHWSRDQLFSGAQNFLLSQKREGKGSPISCISCFLPLFSNSGCFSQQAIYEHRKKPL